MASRVDNTTTLNSSLPKRYNEIAKLSKPKLKELCTCLSIDIEKSTGKKAIVNLICNVLNITTCGLSSSNANSSKTSLPKSKVPPLAYLQTLKDWRKSLQGIQLMIEESIVKEFLIRAGYKQQAVRKYKTLRSWEHKQDIHSVKVHLLPEYGEHFAIRASCKPSFSTDSEESKVIYLVLERSSNKPAYTYCTCTVGLRGDCSHVSALMFILCDIVVEGKAQLPPDPTCTDIPCSWSNPKGSKVEPALVQNINFYKAKIDKGPPTKKLRPSPTVTEKFYGVDKTRQTFIDNCKLELKKDIFSANEGKALPPVYYTLGNYANNDEQILTLECLPDIIQCDDPCLLYSSEVQVESSFDEESINVSVSPIKVHPASLQDIHNKVESILGTIAVDDEKIKQIEEATRLQSKSDQWYSQRMLRITASKCKRALINESTSPTKAMKEILSYNKHFESHHMRDGIECEQQTINTYCKLSGNKVEQCGFFVSKSRPYLGASPDGLIPDGLIEVKRIHPHDGETLEKALQRQHIVKHSGGSLVINRNHSYYYQVQLQLFCAQRKWADFVAFDGRHLFIDTICYNQDFMDVNLPRLHQFYYNVLLLELAYPRVKDGFERIGKFGIDYKTLCKYRQN